MKKMAKIILYLFVFFTAFIGFLYYLNPIPFPSLQNAQTLRDSMTDMLPQCPDLLRQEGTSIVLYDLNQPASDVNPAIFTCLDEYAQFVKEQEAKGVKCPVLELQKGIVGSSLSNAPIAPPISTDLEGSRIFNQGDYPPFDPFNDIVYGSLGTKKRENMENQEDEEEEKRENMEDEEEEKEKQENMENPEDCGMSDNPMDTNWGGVQYSAQTLASGKYDGDMVTRPLYYNMKQGATRLIPGEPGLENPPPNYVPRDLMGQDHSQLQTHNKN
jgi:hypothetical protein